MDVMWHTLIVIMDVMHMAMLYRSVLLHNDSVRIYPSVELGFTISWRDPWWLWRYVVLYCIVLYCIVLYCIVLYCIVLYCIVLYCIVLYCIVLYCIVLYCIVLYCIVLYCW